MAPGLVLPTSNRALAVLLRVMVVGLVTVLLDLSIPTLTVLPVVAAVVVTPMAVAVATTAVIEVLETVVGKMVNISPVLRTPKLSVSSLVSPMIRASNKPVSTSPTMMIFQSKPLVKMFLNRLLPLPILRLMII